ncbi:TPA: hypothetical protein ACHKQC_005477, partial [Escherichia coli]
DWYNNRRLLGRLGHTPPAEAEKAYYASIGNNDLAPEFTDKTLSRKPGAVHRPMSDKVYSDMGIFNGSFVDHSWICLLDRASGYVDKSFRKNSIHYRL